MIRDIAEQIKTDVLIIGCEAAGGRAAIEAREQGADVLVVTKGLQGRSGDTIMAGPGIQAALGHMDPRDNPDVHMEDVVRGGAYLNNQKLVEKLVNLAPAEIPKFEKWGAKFRKIDGKYYQFAPPGSTYPRALSLMGWRGGIHFRRAFGSQIRRLNIKLMEEVVITRLFVSRGQVAGAFGVSIRDGRFFLFRSKNTILATGGCPQIYRETDASPEVTGDGMAMAYDVGAELMDMEFQQSYPLCCYWPTSYRMSGLTADLRYYLHAKFYNSTGEAFMERYFPDAKEWGLRDPTSRAIYLENRYGRGSRHGGAYLSVNHLPENVIQGWIDDMKPDWVPKLEKMGIDIRKHALEVGPGYHYSMGGVRVNENCETNVPRLYAAGEVAAGMDGAERIDGGPALMWCLTMGFVVGQEAAKKTKELDWLDVDAEQVITEQERLNALWERQQGIKGFEVKNKIKDLMWDYSGLVRNKGGLEKALAQIQEIKNEDLPRVCCADLSKTYNRGWAEAIEAVFMPDVAEMIIKAAAMREESRGSHYREDFPTQDDQNWLKNIIIRKEGERMVLKTLPPVITKIKPPQKGQV